MKLEITRIAPHIDGIYDVDLASFTNRELHQIKVASGVRPPEMLDAFVYSDAAFACAVATIACQRANKRINEEIFLDAAGGSIKFVFEEQEDDVDPPTLPGKPGTKPRRSGRASSRSSESPADAPSPSGALT